MSISTGDAVTFEYTGSLTDGPVFDTTREDVAEETGLAARQPDRDYEPFSIEVGAGEIIEGLEEALIGLTVGEEATIEIAPEKAYGERTEERVHEEDAEEFKNMLDTESLEEGMKIQTEGGDVGTIVHAGSDVVRLDFNHELAGETLEFDVEIVEIN